MPAEYWRASHGTRRRLRARLDPLATGWSQSNVETVVAVVDVDRLSALLARLHRDGYGPASRVLNGSREDLQAQCQRLGLDDARVPELDAPAYSLLVIRAAGRTRVIRELLTSCGIAEASIHSPNTGSVGGELPLDLDRGSDGEHPTQESG